MLFRKSLINYIFLFFYLLLPLFGEDQQSVQNPLDTLNLTFIFYNKDLDKVFEKNYLCNVDQRLFECINKSELSKLIVNLSRKNVTYTILIANQPLVYSNLTNLNLSLQEIYQKFYRTFTPSCLVIRSSGIEGGVFSYFDVDNCNTSYGLKSYDLVRRDSYILFTKYYVNTYLKKFLEDVKEVKNQEKNTFLKGIYNYVYMIMEITNNGGVDDPPLGYFINYEKSINDQKTDLKEYLASSAYETDIFGWCEYHPKDTNDHSIDIKKWGTGVCPPEQYVSFNRIHRPYYDRILAVNLSYKNYSNNLSSQEMGLLKKSFSYYDLFNLVNILYEAGIPFLSVGRIQHNSKTKQIWLESLNHTNNFEQLISYPAQKIGLDTNAVNICQLGPAKCKMLYVVKFYLGNSLVKTYSYNPSSPAFQYFIEQLNSSGNNSQYFIEQHNNSDNNSDQDLGFSFDKITIDYAFYCPSTINNTEGVNNRLLTTLTLDIKELEFDNRSSAASFLAGIKDKCKNFVQQSASYFLSNNSAHCGNNVVQVYDLNCQYVQSLDILNQGVLIDGVLEGKTPIFFWITPRNEFYRKNLKDAILYYVDRDTSGNSYYCTGNKCADFFISKNSPEYMKLSYTKVFFLDGFIDLLRETTNN